MTRQIERRRWPREHLSPQEVGIVYPCYATEEQESWQGERKDSLLVYLHNMSEGGFLLESLQRVHTDTLLDVRMRFPHEKVWQAFKGKVVRTEENPVKSGSYFLGVDFQQPGLLEERPMHRITDGDERIYPCDLEFLINTPLLNAIPQEAKCPLLNAMSPRQLKAGARLICQGDEGDNFYLIQSGSCIVSVEKQGVKHPVARLKAGDVVGEVALLTGEPRTAHVDAETDMTLWCLTRAQFDRLCLEYHDLRDFLTELLTYRLSTERLTADRKVGKYVINDILGRGGWSTVYRGVHSSLNMPVAIKMLKHTMAMDLDFSEKFKNEAKIIANLNHENIVKVYDIDEMYRTIFIIMEYLEGLSLEYILNNMPRLPLSRVLDIILQVGAGLSYAHEQGIIHQDVKPGNIIIQPNDRAKILDFGLACSPGTIDFCLPGTVYYMSPEQIEGETLDERTDIYSLGIMAYEMATGQRPYPEDDLGKLMAMHVQEDLPDPRSLVPDLPHELCHFIKRATRRDPSARFKTVWEVLRDLQPVADKFGVERKPHTVEKRKLMSLFLFYQDEQQLMLKRLVEDFSKELKKIGAVLRAADFRDV